MRAITSLYFFALRVLLNQPLKLFCIAKNLNAASPVVIVRLEHPQVVARVHVLPQEKI